MNLKCQVRRRVEPLKKATLVPREDYGIHSKGM